MFASPSFEASSSMSQGAAGRSSSSPPLFSNSDEEDDEEDDEEEAVDEEEEDDDEEEEEEDEEEEEEEEDEDDPVDTSTSAGGATRGAGNLPSSLPNNNNNANHLGSHLTIRAVPEIKLGCDYREIGKEALCWQLSSAKPGNGVEQIRDKSNDTYWQSDGLKQPHWIQVHFARRVAVSHVCLYLDYSLDESYTPKRVSVHHGMTSQDLQSAVYPAQTEIEFAEPNGWCIIPLNAPPDPLDVYHETTNQSTVSPYACIRTHLLRISILAMHQNGRDTHIRQVELYGPRRPDAPLAMLRRMDNTNNHHNNNSATTTTVNPQNDDSVLMDEELTLPRWTSSMWGAAGGVVR